MKLGTNVGMIQWKYHGWAAQPDGREMQRQINLRVAEGTEIDLWSL